MATPTRDLRSVLVDAAEDEVERAGVGGVSLRGIARHAGVSHQAPGHVFRDRAGLFTALAERGYDELATAIEAARADAVAAAADGSVFAGLPATGVAYVGFAEARPGVFSVMVRPELWNAEDPGLAAARARAWGVLERAVTDAQATGWGRGVEHRALVLVCLSMVHGLATLARDGVLAVEEPGATAEHLAVRLTAALGVLGAG